MLDYKFIYIYIFLLITVTEGRQHKYGYQLLAPATNEILNSTKGEEFSEYCKDGPALYMRAFHILVKGNKTAVDYVIFLLNIW